MKSAHIHVLFLLSVICVFGDADKVETVPAIEGGSVTLLTDVTEIQSSDVIEWRFGELRIAKISSGSVSGEFKDRLELDKQTGNLKIRNITATDSGLYILKIKNSKGSSEKTFSVSVSADEVKSMSVLVGDTVTLHTDLTEILRYDEMQWRFERQNSPIAEISRAAGVLSTHDGPDGRFRDRLKLDCLTGSLIITNIRTTHSGVYEVTMSISSSISRSTYTIHKSFSVTVSDGVTSVSVMEGRSVTLQTGVTEIQTDDFILWMFGDTQITVFDDVPDGRFRDRLKLDKKTGSLTITNTRTTDSGLYELQINSSRRTIHRRFTVTVSDGVTSVSVMEGDSVTLQTGVTELQTDDFILWMFGDTRITVYDDVPDGRFRDRLKLDKKTGSLTITNITTEDSGIYELQINSSRRTIHRRFMVTVSGLSSGAVAGTAVGILMAGAGAGAGAAVLIYYCYLIFKQMQETVIVTEGESVPLKPDGTEILKYDIQWKFEDTLIAERKGVNGDFTVHDDVHDGIFKDRLELDQDSGSLIITDIRFTMSGRYELRIIRWGCVSFMKTFTVSVVQRRLIVHEGRSVPLIPYDTEILKDDDIQLKFEGSLIAERKGENGEITVHDGIFKGRLKLDEGSGSLIITDIRFPMSGDYELRIIRPGHESFMKTFTVSVVPKRDEREPVKVKEGDPLTLSSGVTEIQRDDQIQWKFGLEGSPIAQIKGGTTETSPSAAGGRFRDRLKLDQKTGSLTIKNIRPKDAGLYHLYNNTTGKSIKSFMVDVRNPNDVKKNPEETSEACRSNSEEVPLTHVKVPDT